MAIDCKASDKKLKMFGFGIPGQGFYALNFPKSDQDSPIHWIVNHT